ncbi:hypothetical protein [Streptosporangium sp. NPDC087985]|uniref:hypothetical protein n=1 Tax=Streptosporangium sp. NPDC087985 TaxID=3366196 RepID=UPI0037FF3D01
MTITESELREILEREGADGLHRGVTVADVDRRARRIRRRRARFLGGVAAVGLAVAAAFTLPTGSAGTVPDDVWTGVMAQPSPAVPTVSRPVGEPVVGGEIANRAYTVGGVRKELRVRTGNVPTMVQIFCSGPLRRVIIWIDGGAPQKHLCGDGPDGVIFMGWWQDKSGKTATERVVSAAVLPGELDTKEKGAEDLASGMDGLFDGWERQLAEADEFPVTWSIMVRKLIYQPCQDNVRQVDPATGQMVVVRCEKKDRKAGG